MRLLDSGARILVLLILGFVYNGDSYCIRAYTHIGICLSVLSCNPERQATAAMITKIRPEL